MARLARTHAVAESLGFAAGLALNADQRRMLTAIESGLEQVEHTLAAEAAFVDPLADATGRYLLEAGGKRIRPTLALLTAQLGDGVTPQVIRGAAAVEMTHLASLYHDDVMDEAPLRRGVPTVHTVWGNSVAILAGDLLFARASKLIAGLGQRAIDLQAETFEQLCLGQLHETVGPQPGDDPIEHYLQVLADKTGSLIALAGQIGLLFSDAPDDYRAAITTYGEAVGVAFQLVDDVIDLSPNAHDTGKSFGTDLKAGVPTMPLLLLERDSDPNAAALVARLRSGDADAVAQLREHPVTRATLAEAHRWAADAVAALAPLPEGAVKSALTRFADAIVERDH